MARPRRVCCRIDCTVRGWLGRRLATTGWQGGLGATDCVQAKRQIWAVAALAAGILFICMGRAEETASPACGESTFCHLQGFLAPRQRCSYHIFAVLPAPLLDGTVGAGSHSPRFQTSSQHAAGSGGTVGQGRRSATAWCMAAVRSSCLPAGLLCSRRLQLLLPCAAGQSLSVTHSACLAPGRRPPSRGVRLIQLIFASHSTCWSLPAKLLGYKVTSVIGLKFLQDLHAESERRKQACI